MGVKHPKLCRGVVVTVDGKRHLAPWRGSHLAALKAAERFALRKGLKVAEINALSVLQKEEVSHEHE